MNKIAAGIITYNPNISRLKQNISSILLQVECVILYDNNSRNRNEIEKMIKEYNNVILITSDENRGLAVGLNEIMNYALKLEFSWVISLDQDSVLQEDAVEKFSCVTGDSEIAIVCPYVLDSRRKYMSYNFDKEIEDVDMCITSGSMTNLKIWKEIEGFDDWLFIDLIDNDYCKKLRINNYRIVRVNTVLMNQEFGEIKPKSRFLTKFYVKLGELLRSTNVQKLSYEKIVDPVRVYYTNRNILYLNKKYMNFGGIGYKENYHCNTYFGFLICFSLASFIRGKNKQKILNSIISGIRDGKSKAKETYAYNIKRGVR